MAKQGEIDYLKMIGEEGVRHAAGKPFTDAQVGRYLMELGAVFTLLPPAPATLLDIGCGTGWTSVFFAKAGYRVTGVDISPDMIHHAERNKAREGLGNLSFLVSDYEDMRFTEAQQFDCAVFFDSLHHAIDPQAAVNMAYRALKPGGRVVTSEPGQGHEENPESIEHVKKYNVTEQDMPPEKIIQLGKKAGFRSFRVFPHAFDLNHFIYTEYNKDFERTASAKTECGEKIQWLFGICQHNGMLMMVK